MQSFNDHLGIRPGDDERTVIIDTRDEHLIAPETIHFAVLATLGEVAAAKATGGTVVPASINLQLLRRARPGRLIGRGRLLRKGRRVAFAEGEVWQNDQLVAKVTVQLSVLA